MKRPERKESNEEILALYRKQGKKKKNEEDELQIACVKWFRETYPDILLIHVPNQRKSRGFTKRDGTFVPTEQVRLNAMGVMAGVSDLLLFHRKHESVTYNGLAIEMKTPIGSQSISQKKFEVIITKAGWKYVILRTLEDFKKTITNYMGLNYVNYV